MCGMMHQGSIISTAAVFSNPPVTDPTDAPGDTTTYGNLPAVLADMAVGGNSARR